MESKGFILNIGKAAKLSNLTVKTVRYYADIGLVSPVKNSKTGYRDFSEDDVARLQFVSKARKFNFSIRECEELLSLYSNKNRSCLLYTSPSPRDNTGSRMPSSA